MPEALTASDLLERAEAIAPRYRAEIASVRRRNGRMEVVCRASHPTAADLVREALSSLAHDSIAVIFERDGSMPPPFPKNGGRRAKGTGRLEDVDVRPLPTDGECAALGRDVAERMAALACNLFDNAVTASTRAHLERQAERHGCADGRDFLFRYLVRSAAEGDVDGRTEEGPAKRSANRATETAYAHA